MKTLVDLWIICIFTLACGGCGSCKLPGGKSAIETFADYIDGKVEFSAIASRLWNHIL